MILIADVVYYEKVLNLIIDNTTCNYTEPDAVSSIIRASNDYNKMCCVIIMPEHFSRVYSLLGLVNTAPLASQG